MGNANKFLAPITKKVDPVFGYAEKKIGLSALMPTPTDTAATASATSIDQRAIDKKNSILAYEENERRRLGGASSNQNATTGLGSASVARKTLLGA